MRTLRWLVGLLFFILFITLISPAQAAQTGNPEWALQNGRFYTQAASGQGGFSVVNDDAANFWSEFQRLGGAETVGYPISTRFEYDGFVTQAFQKLVLQWRPEVNQAWPLNVFDELHAAGVDDALHMHRQTPLHTSASNESGMSWEEVVSSRQSWLDDNEAIRDRYFAVTDPVTTFGLPTSRVEDMGNHYALRTQRAVFQQWKEAVPWASQGQVTIANGGDIAKEYGWLSGGHMQPEDPANYPVYVPPTPTPVAPYGAPYEAKWIDVNLTTQTIRAYEWDRVVYTARVSTGRWGYETVTGQYRIWIKLRYDDMTGGSRERGDYYYLEDVPYVMYFYQGYGIHGTYWHNNFGTPMSAGCVNLTIADAQWFFNWANVGTLVYSHY